MAFRVALRVSIVIVLSFLVTSCGGASTAMSPSPQLPVVPADPPPGSLGGQAEQQLKAVNLVDCTDEELSRAAAAELILALRHDPPEDDRVQTVLWFPVSGAMCWRADSRF